MIWDLPLILGVLLLPKLLLCLGLVSDPIEWRHIPSLFNSCCDLTIVKSKIIVSCWHFFADMIFSAIWKVQTYENKTREKSLYYTQTNTCLLHISRNFKVIFKIYALLSIYSKLLTTETVQSSVSICCCLPFFQQILDPIILESIWSYNDLASILRY